MAWHPKDRDEALRQEIEAHLELEAREQSEAGATEEGARNAARRVLGGHARVLEDTRGVHTNGWLAARQGEIRLALRLLYRYPSFTLVALATLAFAIGANSVVFSVIDAAILRPLPFPEPQRLVTMRSNQSLPDVEDILAWSDSLASGGGLTMMPMDLVGSGEPVQISAGFVSPQLLEALAVPAQLGRVFTKEEENAGPAAVVLLNGFWQSQFGGDPSIVGRSLRLGGTLYEVVGVMPPEFSIPPYRLDALVPLRVAYAEGANARGAHFLRTVWRLEASASLQSAREELALIDRRLAESYPVENTDRRTILLPLQDWLSGNSRQGLFVLLAAVGAVLMIGCANLANMLLARAVTREQELSVRAALGASRGRMFTQFLAESLVLGVAGGIAGLAVAFVGIRAVNVFKPESLQILPSAALDLRVFAFTAGLTLLTVLLFGLLPALRSVAMHGQTRGTNASMPHGRWRNALVVAEIALALILVTGAGLLFRSFLLLQGVDPGFQTDNLMTLRMQLPQTRYDDVESQTRFRTAVLERLNALPAVEASMVSELPLSGSWLFHNLVLEGEAPLEPGTEPEVQSRSVAGEYWAHLGIPIIQGRVLSESDVAGRPLVAVVNQTFVRRYLNGRNAIGARVRWARAEGDLQWIEVVGVCGDVRHFSLMQDDEPAVYTPYAQSSYSWKRWMTLVLRADSFPAERLATVKREIWRVDPEIPVTNIGPLEGIVADSLESQRFYMMLLAVFAALSLAMAGIGVYAVIAFLVTQRRAEIGVRMAMGARPADVIVLVLRQTGLLAAAGMALGLTGSLVLMQGLESMLYGVDALDPFSLCGAAGVLLVIAFTAVLAPARRAAMTDAAHVLRL